ncbi:MAG: radical SAM protein [Candidatus Thorarchaeota archaeon]
MNVKQDIEKTYNGYEMGPIRPPSEARSLLLRVTRNCHWNRCGFCPVYKQVEFSTRPKSHVIQDIDSISSYIELIQEAGSLEQFFANQGKLNVTDPLAYRFALRWFNQGMKSVFIQDADSLISPPSNIISILTYLRKKFPSVERVTSYARSSTIAKIGDADLKAISGAGLNRIHIGMESGSDNVLKMVRKGASKEIHIRAGLKVLEAGMQLSEYVMPGLGGIKLSEEHAVETADALNQINPDFIRLRQLAIPNSVPLFAEQSEGRFVKCTDIEIVHELRLFIESLEGINSQIVSDHILNLLPEIDGQLPEDQYRLISIVDSFLEMDTEKQLLYQLGKRMGIFHSLKDLEDSRKTAQVQVAYNNYGVSSENIDELTSELMKRFI